MHKLIGFIITISFKFTCILPCTLIKVKLHRRTNLQLTKYFFKNTIKVQLMDQSQKLAWIQLHSSEYYELNLNFDETEIKLKPDNLSNIYICILSREHCDNWGKIVSCINLTDSSTFPPYLIKRKKLRCNQKTIFIVTQSDVFAQLQ